MMCEYAGEPMLENLIQNPIGRKCLVTGKYCWNYMKAEAVDKCCDRLTAYGEP